MSNQDFVSTTFRGHPCKTANRHSYLHENSIIIRHYLTDIARIDTQSKKVILNITKYSRSTSKLQSLIQREAFNLRYEIEETEDENNLKFPITEILLPF